MKNQRFQSVFRYIFTSNYLKMRITIALMLLSFFQLNATTSSYGQAIKVSIEVKDVSLLKIFQEIEDQTEYRFFYNNKDFDLKQKMALNVEEQELTEVLQSLFSSTDISYEVLGKQIVLKKKNAQTNGLTHTISDQQTQKSVEGTITDERGNLLVGVTVIVEGTQKGVVSNFDGFYKISLTDDENVLVFSSLGYKTERFEVNNNTTFNLVMSEDLNQLSEIVLIGYGEQKREDVTGAVSSVDTDQMVQSSVGNVGFDRALGGLVKGVQVTQSSGRPGAPVRLNIRGVTSPLSSYGLNQPLYVINGVPFNTDDINANPLLTLNPNDIESLDVLKDAAATSIYGSRGANGVILIQTKRGQKGQKPTVSFSAATSVSQPVNTVNVLDANQYYDFYDLLTRNSINAVNAGQLDPFMTVMDLENIANVDLDYDTFLASYDGLRDDYFGAANTNWSKEVYRSLAVTQQTNFNIRGGSNKTSYNFGLSAIDQEGLTIKDKMKQYTVNMSLDSDITDYVKVGGTTSLSHTNSKSGEDSGIGLYTINTSIARARPDLPVYDADGNLLGQTDYAYGFETLEPNPLMRLQHKNEEKAYNFIGNTYIEVEPVNNLKLKADVNAAVFHRTNSIFSPKIVETDFIIFPNDSYLDESSALVTNVTTNLTANYSLSLSDHHLNILGGAAWDRTKTESSSQMFAGFPDDDVLTNASSAESIIGYSSNKLNTGLNSIFSRLTYSYKNLYNATINFRTDTSSKFGPGNKRGYFPSLSTSWNISNEKFLNKNDKINSLRLRTSIGRVGSTNVSDFAYLQFFSTSSGNIYNGSSAILPTDTFPNLDIGWETTNEVNVGLDFAFFDSRLRGSIDMYNRKTTDALVRTPVPLELGPRVLYSNFIDVSNKGVELSIGGDIIRTEDFTWSANLNWATNKNRLDKLKGANIDAFLLDHFIEGQPVGTIKGYKVVKIFNDQGEIDDLNTNSPTGLYDKFSTGIGDFMFEDINGDGRITSEDKTIIGNIEPDFFGGLSNTFHYKAFSLSALFQFSVGAEAMWDPIIMDTYNNIGENKYSEYALNTWTPDNPDARFARTLYSDPSANSRTSDRYLYDTSYLRLKSLQLTYNLDANILKNTGIDNAILTLTANNLYTWTKWPGIDPEALSERGSIVDQISGEDPYPLSKSFTLGVQIQF